MARICDRCGESNAVFELEVNDHRYFTDLAKKLDSVVLWGKIKHEPFDQIDLCSNCYDSFKVFMKAKKRKTRGCD